MKRATKLAMLLAALALPLAMAQGAEAALTPAGTVITNQATLAYTVGGIIQPASPSTATTFNVDRKVNFNVTYVPGTFVNVFPGSNNQVLTYTVTNLGNDTQDFNLAVAQLNGGAVLTGTDSIDAADVRLFLDSDGNGSFDSAVDEDITATHYLDELAPIAGVSATVFIVGNFPTPQINGNVAGLTLAANALHGHSAGAAGGAINEVDTDTNGAVSGNPIFTVFADVADSQSNLERVAGAFRIAAPVLTVEKQANVIWDPVNFNTNTPRSIPGSYVQYTITIANDATALESANLTTIQDTLDNNTTLDPNLIGTALDTDAPGATSGAGQSFKVTHTAADRSTASPSYYSNGGGVTVVGQSISADFTALLPVEGLDYTAGELKPGQSVTLTFNVSIN